MASIERRTPPGSTRFALSERIQAAAAATQMALSVEFARSQVLRQQDAGLADPRTVGRGIADQLALACRVSPTEGSRRLETARALYAGQPVELPATFVNGRATCVRTNQAREMPGWAVRLVHDGLGDQPHTL